MNMHSIWRQVPHPPHRVPDNAIGPEGARAVADALTVNRTVHTIYLYSMALPLNGRLHSIRRIARQCYESVFFCLRATSRLFPENIFVTRRLIFIKNQFQVERGGGSTRGTVPCWESVDSPPPIRFHI